MLGIKGEPCLLCLLLFSEKPSKVAKMLGSFALALCTPFKISILDAVVFKRAFNSNLQRFQNCFSKNKFAYGTVGTLGQKLLSIRRLVHKQTFPKKMA